MSEDTQEPTPAAEEVAAAKPEAPAETQSIEEPTTETASTPPEASPEAAAEIADAALAEAVDDIGAPPNPDLSFAITELEVVLENTRRNRAAHAEFNQPDSVKGCDQRIASFEAAIEILREY